MYEVFGSATNRAFRVVWMLEELGEPFEHHKLQPRSKELLEVNPSGKSPALRAEGRIITDSSAIIAYLADKHGKFTFPAGTIERAQQDAWTHLVLDEVDSVLWMAARHSFILPDEKRVPDVKPSLKWEFDETMARIAEQIDGPYLMGEAFTVPDIIFTHCLNWAYSAKFEVTEENILSYAKACRAREAFKRTRERAKA